MKKEQHKIVKDAENTGRKYSQLKTQPGSTIQKFQGGGEAAQFWFGVGEEEDDSCRAKETSRISDDPTDVQAQIYPRKDVLPSMATAAHNHQIFWVLWA